MCLRGRIFIEMHSPNSLVRIVLPSFIKDFQHLSWGTQPRALRFLQMATSSSRFRCWSHPCGLHDSLFRFRHSFRCSMRLPFCILSYEYVIAFLFRFNCVQFLRLLAQQEHDTGARGSTYWLGTADIRAPSTDVSHTKSYLSSRSFCPHALLLTVEVLMCVCMFELASVEQESDCISLLTLPSGCKYAGVGKLLLFVFAFFLS